MKLPDELPIFSRENILDNIPITSVVYKPNNHISAQDCYNDFGQTNRKIESHTTTALNDLSGQWPDSPFNPRIFNVTSFELYPSHFCTYKT